jgi:hypothetical protein
MNTAVKYAAVLIFFGLATGLPAATSLPAGSVLPVRLNSTLSSANTYAGRTITARLMQDVPLPDGSAIHAGARVIGHVVSVKPVSGNSPARVSLQFDTLETHRQKIPIAGDLRAIASFVAVDQAQIPNAGPDRGTPEYAWTTTQVGGETVYRGGGKVEGAHGPVGRPIDGGVLSQVNANPEGGCRGAINANEAPQAFWVFSSDACGVYDLPNLTIRHSGRSSPVGQITLEAVKGEIDVRAGAGMLLRLNAPGTSRS